MAWARHVRATAAALLVLGGCKQDDTVLLPFNDEADSVDVFVGVELVDDDPECEPGQSCAELHSLVEGAVIGSITVDPAAGMVGTVHRLIAVVGDEWEDRIDRVSVVVESDRGEGEFELVRDRANPGAWGLDLQSLGTPREERVDTWTVYLWEGVSKKQADDASQGDR